MPLCHELTEIKYALQSSLAGLEEEQIQTTGKTAPFLSQLKFNLLAN